MLCSLESVSEVLRGVGEQLILPAFQQNIPSEEKSPGELVTEVDRAAENFLTRSLPSLVLQHWRSGLYRLLAGDAEPGMLANSSCFRRSSSRPRSD